MRFGISTHLYHDRRLNREHLAQIASYGFDTIELFATRSHFDYHDASAIAQLAEWLADTGLSLASVHAPIATSLTSGQWAGPLSNAVRHNAQRQRAVRESEAALQIAKRIPFQLLVVHLGTPAAYSQPGDNNRASAFRSADEICRLAEPVGVGVALEVIPNDLSDAQSLVTLLERDLDAPRAGICLDFGHAHLDGDVIDAVETVAEHLIATHLHDNRGRADDHLMPLDGTIDWAAALTAVQKIGYDGPMMFEVGAHGPAKESLARLKKAREKMERWLTSI